MNTIKIVAGLLLVVITGAGCKKFLDAKPDKSLEVPSNVVDLQALLDNYRKTIQEDPSGGEISADNYYLSDADFDGLYEPDMRRLYTWEQEHVFSDINNMWNNAYQAVYTPNAVLDNLPAIARTAGNADTWDDIKGEALYYRAREFHLIAGIWALAYDSLTSKSDLGIPLRLNSDFNTVSTRGDLETTYNSIIGDLREAIPLLPVKALSISRPSRSAAYGLLARVYLTMRKYDLAGKYADSCLQLYHSLLDYNSLDPTSSAPIGKFNVENIQYSFAGDWGPLNNSVAKIDSVLYASYDSNDLRKTIFFKSNNDGTYGFKGNYTGAQSSEQTGPATEEVYLVRAECLARQGDIAGAMADLNTLLVTRWKAGTFVPFTSGSAAEALQLVLKERRKELLYRELRWMDIKRLNKEGAGITLTRIVKGQTYTLAPNDLRYAVSIPEEVIRLTGMQQNPR